MKETIQIVETTFKNRQALKERYLRECRYGGLIVSTSAPISIDERVVLKVWLRREDLCEQIQGVVLWCRSETQTKRLAGVGFLEREAEKRERLMRGIRPSLGAVTDRKEPRHNMSMKVRYQHNNYLVIANTQNISPGGMFLRTPSIPPLGSEILFTLYPPYASDSLELPGRVAWQQFGAGVGVEFNRRIPDGF